MNSQASKIKPWSISTTVRNPERLRGFLGVLKQMDNTTWDREAQVAFQIRLIQARLFGAYNPQFYKELPQHWIELMESGDEIDLVTAGDIFAHKEYEDPPMRGRTSFKALQKFGFAGIFDGAVRVTDLGRALLEEEDDYGEIFLRALLKWQLPNPLDQRSFPASDGYNIKPFVGTLRLIEETNRRCRQNDLNEKGLSRREFAMFAMTLIDWQAIEKTADEIVTLRKQASKHPVPEREAFVDSEMRRLRSEFQLKHVQDYADNAIRYFRLTKYIRIRGWGDHIDLEPSRKNETQSLFKRDEGKPDDFQSEAEYAQYLGSATDPDLPGETSAELIETVKHLSSTIQEKGGKTEPFADDKPVSELIKKRDSLRSELQSLIRNNEKQQLRDPDKAAERIAELRQLGEKRKRGEVRPSVKLEELATEGLDILNDAIKIQPNFPMGDDGKPSSTAPGGKADIECYYSNFAAICEVTLLSDSKQWIHEAQPVMRHLFDFGKANEGQETYCLFIAPNLHKDSLNMFRFSAQSGYEEELQRFIPLTISQFCDILDFCVERLRGGKSLNRDQIKTLWDSISESLAAMSDSDSWRTSVPEIIEQWKRQI